MAMRVALFLAVLLVPCAARAAVTDCPDCKGRREVDCADCGGKGKSTVPCAECVEGKVKCAHCIEGRKPCHRCGGSGSKMAIVLGNTTEGSTDLVPCPTTERCSKCSGRSYVDCKACRRKGTILVTCFSCEGKRKERCLPCFGTGKVGEPDPDPEAAALEADASQQARRLPGQRASIRDAIETLEDAARRAAKLDAERRAVLESMERLKGRIASLGKRSSEEPALRRPAELLVRRWKASQDLASLTVERIEESIAGLLSREGIGELEVLASDLDAGKVVAPAVLDGKAASARKQKRGLAGMGGILAGARAEMGRWEKEAGGFEVRLKDHLAKKELDRRRAEEIRGAYLRVEKKIPSLAEKAGLSGIDCGLLGSPSPKALRIELTCFDESAAVCESPEDSVPGDDILAKLPALVSAVFHECPEVEKIRLCIDATCLTETGHEERQTIQRFAMDQGRWQKLASGKYRDEWWTLLSKSQPTPEYPRPSRIPEGTWPIVALLGICFLGTAIVFAARARMLS